MLLPSYAEFVSRITTTCAAVPNVHIEPYAQLHYGPKVYTLLKLVSRDIAPTDKIVLIRAGIHGNEVAGPLTFFQHAPEIFKYAHDSGVKLIVYPLDNPSGFENGERYAEDNPDRHWNNDFLRYELEDGQIVDDLRDRDEFRKWFWSSDPRLKIDLPQETLALHKELKAVVPLTQVRATIDLHQDPYIIIPTAYHYGYGDLSIYTSITEQIASVIPIRRDEHIESGPDLPDDYEPDEFDPRTDANGFVVHYDGSLPDLFHRLGARHCISVETTTVTPPDIANEINLIWIYGIIDLVNNIPDGINH